MEAIFGKMVLDVIGLQSRAEGLPFLTRLRRAVRLSGTETHYPVLCSPSGVAAVDMAVQFSRNDVLQGLLNNNPDCPAQREIEPHVLEWLSNPAQLLRTNFNARHEVVCAWWHGTPFVDFPDYIPGLYLEGRWFFDDEKDRCPVCDAELLLPRHVVLRRNRDMPRPELLPGLSADDQHLAIYCRKEHAVCSECDEIIPDLQELACPLCRPDEYGGRRVYCAACCPHEQCPVCARMVQETQLCSDCDNCTAYGCCRCADQWHMYTQAGDPRPLPMPHAGINPRSLLFQARSYREDSRDWAEQPATLADIRRGRFLFPRHVGVEFELSEAKWAKIAQHPLLKRAPITTDSSIRATRSGSGGELVSPPMQGIFATRFFDAMGSSDISANANDSCGMHVHVNACDLSPEQMHRVVHAWSILQPAMFSLVPEGRRYNRVADRVDSIHYAYECGVTARALPWTLSNAELRELMLIYAHYPASYWRSAKPPILEHIRSHGREQMAIKEIRRPNKKLLVLRLPATAERVSNKYHAARYSAMNIYSWVRNGTIEFRLQGGFSQANAANRMYWAAFCSRFVDWAAMRIKDPRRMRALEANYDPVSPIPTSVRALSTWREKNYGALLEEIVRGDPAFLDYLRAT